ncbi:MAG: ABC transporter ATP-binding protein [Rhodospirillales bacterium]|jgi:ABC-type sugar transport system ATPase subunit|nr:ABC transporter ATP-binding protein [Rhodospirillales bacterium]
MARVDIKNLVVRFGDFTAVDDVSMTIDDGEMVVFLGPSGCGKTTTLRCVAGLEQGTSGSIEFDGNAVDTLSPSQRNIAMVFQFVTLYPHLKVADNIAFPLRARGMAKPKIRQKLDWIAEVFSMGDLMKRYPPGLPPGAKQKVALARAVVREPKVLLLDEPLSAIDERFREEMRWELGHLQKQLGFTTIYVTHDQREAMSLADRIALMRDGKIVQIGSPADMYDRPVNEFAGFFIGSPGMNFVDARIEESTILLGSAGIPISAPGEYLAKVREAAGPEVRLGIRPQDVHLEADGDGDGLLKAEIVNSYAVGRERFFDFRIDDSVLKGMDPSGTGLTGDTRIRFPIEKVHFFDRTSGERLSNQ